jgi:hypothetical protein
LCRKLKKRGLLHWKRVDREIDQDLGDPEAVNENSYASVNENTPLVMFI